MDVGGPVVLCRVGVAGADVAGLEGLELLLGAEFVGLEGEGGGLVGGKEGGEGGGEGGRGDGPLLVMEGRGREVVVELGRRVWRLRCWVVIFEATLCEED